jgi:hypothetical protein
MRLLTIYQEQKALVADQLMKRIRNDSTPVQRPSTPKPLKEKLVDSEVKHTRVANWVSAIPHFDRDDVIFTQASFQFQEFPSPMSTDKETPQESRESKPPIVESFLDSFWDTPEESRPTVSQRNISQPMPTSKAETKAKTHRYTMEKNEPRLSDFVPRTVEKIELKSNQDIEPTNTNTTIENSIPTEKAGET